MSKPISHINNEANQVNKNLGSPGTNLQYDQAQGNRGKQLNPNQHAQARDGDEEDDMESFGHELGEGNGI